MDLLGPGQKQMSTSPQLPSQAHAGVLQEPGTLWSSVAGHGMLIQAHLTAVQPEGLARSHTHPRVSAEGT